MGKKDCYEEGSHALGKANRPLTMGSSVAVDKAKIPIGTMLLIQDVEPRIANDVGGRIKGNHLDEYKGPFDSAKDTTLHDKLVCQKERP